LYSGVGISGFAPELTVLHSGLTQQIKPEWSTGIGEKSGLVVVGVVVGGGNVRLGSGVEIPTVAYNWKAPCGYVIPSPTVAALVKTRRTQTWTIERRQFNPTLEPVSTTIVLVVVVV